jgi:glutathione S-transferase
MKKEQSGTPKSRIPIFANREEEAAFWDTHDITDYLDELKPVTMRAAQPVQVRNLSANVQVRFDEETDKKLEEQARTRGVKKATLLRMWILERLKEEEHRQAS